MKAQNYLALVVLLLGAFAASAARPAYEVIDLGTLPGGGFPAIATAINDHSQITGTGITADLRSRSFLVETGGLRDLGVGPNNSYPRDMNASGEVVGYFTTDWDATTEGRDHAFLYSAGVVTDLSVQFGRYLAVAGLNNHGDFVGNAENDEGTAIVPFVCTNGVFALAGSPETQFADINDAGLIMGTITSNSSVLHAALFGNDRVIDLGVPRGQLWSIGLRLNNSGVAIGYSADAHDLRRAFVWSEGRMRSVRPLPRDKVTFLNDINDSGIAVGSSSIPDGRKRAVIWRNNHVRDLNKLIARDTGWLLIDATSINNQRQIVGGGLFAGEYHAFLLNPVERSTAR